jgi:HEAT repeat protein
VQKGEKMLGDSDSSIRYRAAESLGELGPDAKEAVPALQRALTDTVPAVRIRATNALSKIDPERYPQKKEP